MKNKGIRTPDLWIRAPKPLGVIKNGIFDGLGDQFWLMTILWLAEGFIGVFIQYNFFHKTDSVKPGSIPTA